MFIKFIKKIFFSEITPLIRASRKKSLSQEDIPSLPKFLDPREDVINENSISYHSASLLIKSLIRVGKKYFIPALLLYILSALFSLLSPLLIHQLLSVLSNDLYSPSHLKELFGLTIALGISTIASGLLTQHYYYKTLILYQIYTSALNRKLFWHSLHLNPQDRMKTPVGDIVNHMSTDTDALANLALVIGDIFNSVLLLTGATSLLFYYLGEAGLIAFLFFLILIPISKKLAKNFTKIDDELMEYRDQRITLMSQILNAISIIKYFVLEKSVHEEVEAIRKKELKCRWQLVRAEMISTFIYTSLSTLVLFFSLLLFVFLGGKISAALIFSCMALFTLLEEPLGSFSKYLSALTYTFVAAKRICQFLSQKPLEEINHFPFSYEPPQIIIENLEFQYEGSLEPSIKNISFKIPSSSSMAIVGAVGSGKSTLLHCLLRELPLKKGKISYLNQNGTKAFPRISYISQEPYILSGTIKENILFGAKNISDQQLQKAIELSALKQDLLTLPGGIDTEIGEKGVNLSGGQKQRLSIARAIIHKPNLILMDDPLSAVDPHTEKYLIDHLIMGEWKNTTRIVVTHRLEHLKDYDQIVFLNHGTLIEQGSLNDLLNAPISHTNSYLSKAHTFTNPTLINEKITSFKDFYAHHKISDRLTLSLPETKFLDQEGKRNFIEIEEKAVGQVKNRIYIEYLKALGGKNLRERYSGWTLLILGTLASALLPLLQNGWLAIISNNKQYKNEILNEFFKPINSIFVYGFIGLFVLFIFLMNHLYWLRRGVEAGKLLHENLFHSVINATMRFFSSTPVGRIVQRFSRDLGDVEMQLQWSFESTIRCLTHILVTLFLIISVLPVMIFFLIPLLTIYYFIQKDYRTPVREAKRMDSISRSPRYAHFKETLQGLSTIRSYQKSDWFMEEFYKKLYHNHHMFYGHYMINRWFSTRIPLLGGAVSIFTTLGLCLAVYHGQMNSGIAGLVITYTLSLWAYLNWAIRSFAEVESRMTSMERIHRYSSVKAEPQIHENSTTRDLDFKWPQKGEMQFENVWARYSEDLPFILKGLNFHIPAYSKVGIIGKTGAGKSTLFQSLFRMIELYSGKILIDGVNIASIPLSRLRKSMAIIPQDPILFLGSLRSNLDRYNEYNDSEIYEVLKKVQLLKFVKSLPQDIYTEIKENGLNLSLGQRQLLCLARALLLKVKILVLDEATASVDVQTDLLIQKLIRNYCTNMTIIIIAHRLSTVADCDQIIELDHGKIKREILKENTLSH